MKTLFVIPSKNGISGASIAAINIILGLLKRNIEVYVVASEPPLEYKVFLDDLSNNGAHLFMVSSDESGLKYWKSLAKKSIEVIIKYDISIVHLHLPKLVYFLKKIKSLNRKIVLTVEGDPLLEVKELDFLTRIRMKFLWRECIKYSDIICPCSEWLTNHLKERDKISNIITVHNAINVARFLSVSGGIRNSLDTPNDEFVVMTATRLTPVKGVDILIRGFADFVKNTKSSATLWILGSGELQKQLEDLSVELGIRDRVLFHGFRNNPQDYLAECDVFVMCSTYEPFGMPAAEAGVLSIPVIVSKAGGLTEIVIHGKSGYQFEIGDYKQLSSYLEELFNNKETRIKFGQNAKAYVMTHFSPEVIADKIIQIYSKLV